MRETPSRAFRKEAAKQISLSAQQIIDQWKANKTWFCKPHSEMPDRDIEDQGSHLLSHLAKYMEKGKKDDLIRWVRNEVKTRVSQGYKPEDVEDTIRFWSYLVIRTLRPKFKKEEHRNIFTELASEVFDDLLGVVCKEGKDLYLADLELRVEERTQLLRESEDKFRSIFESANEGLTYLDVSGKILDVNESAAKIFGRSRKGLVGKHLKDVGLASSRNTPILMNDIEQLLTGEGLLQPLHIKNKKGQEMDLECSASLVKTGKDMGVMIIARDVTKRRWTEEELRRSEERLKILFRFAPDVCVLIDAEGNLVDGNRAAEELLGYVRDEGIRKNLFDLGVLPPEETERLSADLAKSAKGQPTGPDELVLIGKDGKRVTVEVRTYPVKIEGRDLMLATARDITKRKQAERAKNILLSNTSHELRTPLTSIEGYAKFMLSGKIGVLPKNQEKCLKVIVEESDRLRGLIDNFLDLITIDTEGLKMDMREVSIAQIIDRLISSMKIVLEEKRISLAKRFSPDMGSVKGDDARLHQLFSNLLSNAIKFTPTGGSIEITSRKDNSSITVEVKDSGVGISPEDLPHIFERFYQGNSSSRRRFRGIGLGLAICNEIAEAHGGHIEVESELDKGSTFRVTLPRIEEVSYGKKEDNGG